MKILLCFVFATLCTFESLTAGHLHCVAVKDPAVAPDLRTFYRSIQALIGDSMLNGTAVAIV